MEKGREKGSACRLYREGSSRYRKERRLSRKNCVRQPHGKDAAIRYVGCSDFVRGRSDSDRRDEVNAGLMIDAEVRLFDGKQNDVSRALWSVPRGNEASDTVVRGSDGWLTSWGAIEWWDRGQVTNRAKVHVYLRPNLLNTRKFVIVQFSFLPLPWRSGGSAGTKTAAIDVLLFFLCRF